MPDNSIDVWNYSNYDNKIVSQKFGCLNPTRIITPNFVPVIPYKNTDIIYKDYSKITVMELLLGFKCNFKCKYCPQIPNRKHIRSSTIDDVEPFLDILRQSVQQGLSNVEQVRFWGGEPLVYWDIIKSLLPKLQEVYPRLKQYSIVTNGWFLTKQIVDDISKFNVVLTLSSDCCSEEGSLGARDKNIMNSAKHREIIEYAKQKLNDKFMIMSVISCDGLSPTQVYDNLCNTLGDTPFTPVSFKYNSSNSDYYTDLTTVEKQRLIDSYYQLTINHTDQLRSMARYHSFKERVVQRIPNDSMQYRCYNNTNWITCDMVGNVFNCKIDPLVVGKLDDLDSIAMTGLTHWQYRETNCKQCPVVNLCGGGCTRMDEVFHTRTCVNSWKPKCLGQFKAAFEQLFNVKVKRISNDEIDISL